MSGSALQLSKLKEKKNHQELLNTSVYYFQSKSPPHVSLKSILEKQHHNYTLFLSSFLCPFLLLPTYKGENVGRTNRPSESVKSLLFSLGCKVVQCPSLQRYLPLLISEEDLCSVASVVQIWFWQLHRKRCSRCKTKIPVKSKANWNTI